MNVLVLATGASVVGWCVFRGFEVACAKLGYRATLFDLLPCFTLLCLFVIR
jgi:hypothetical protein